MQNVANEKKLSSRFSTYTWMMVLVWTGLIFTLFFFNFINIRKEFPALARLEALAGFNKDTAYRRWATLHGGVYVPVTEKTSPNPYLKNTPERDISTPSGKKLTLMNPAYMTRQAHEIGREQYGLQGHITSLKPLNPQNSPDPWETEALKAFEHGKDEVGSIELIDGQPYFRFMRPFMVEEGCLRCHADQGYKIGDVRGGISLSVPMEPYLAAARRRTVQIGRGLGIVWLIGLTGLFLGMGQVKKRIREQEAAEAERNRFFNELQESLKNSKRLRGLLPICASCKNIRDDKGYWQQIESYVRDHSEADFSHSICPDCAKKLYPDLDIYDENEIQQ